MQEIKNRWRTLYKHKLITMKTRKYVVKIGSNMTILYSKEKNILTLIGPLKRTSIKLKKDLFLIVTNDTIEVKALSFGKLSNYQKKRILSLQGTALALIKQAIIETSYLLYTKLKFVGIGYRALPVDQLDDKLLSLKLGYSHSIFFKPTTNTNIFCLKRTKLFVWGNSYQDITKIASKIRSYKKPEPYKGKGILYENEKIKLKEGKKV